MSELTITATATAADGSQAESSVTVEVSAAVPVLAAREARNPDVLLRPEGYAALRPEMTADQPQAPLSGLESPSGITGTGGTFSPPRVTQARRSQTYAKFTGGYR
jgi:hypothetical protein